MSEQNKEVGWADLVGPVVKAEALEGRPEINEADLIVLKTADDTTVCPVQQFETFVDESGAQQRRTSRYVGLGWKVSKLSGQSEWTVAGGFFAPLQGRDQSRCAALLEPQTSHDEKIGLLSEILADEHERSEWLGDESRLHSDLLRLGEEYGFELANVLTNKGSTA